MAYLICEHAEDAPCTGCRTQLRVKTLERARQELSERLGMVDSGYFDRSLSNPELGYVTPKRKRNPKRTILHLVQDNLERDGDAVDWKRLLAYLSFRFAVRLSSSIFTQLGEDTHEFDVTGEIADDELREAVRVTSTPNLTADDIKGDCYAQWILDLACQRGFIPAGTYQVGVSF